MKIGFLAAMTLAICVAAPACASAATRIDDPVKFVAGVYTKIADSSKMTDKTIPDDIYTPRLAALFALEAKEDSEGVGRYDFEFWTDAQDWQLTKIKVTGAPVEEAKDRRIVVAKFNNLGTAEEIHFYFERSKNGWLLDDARSAGKTNPWTLSLVLKYGAD
jgi:hypothetical protein